MSGLRSIEAMYALDAQELEEIMNNKVRTADLTGAALDWAVAKCEGKDNDCEIHAGNVMYGRVTSGFVQYKPSTDWAQGGAIIERELIRLVAPTIRGASWTSLIQLPPFGAANFHQGWGETPLIAAMRCYVASKLGDEVELPEGLK